jgi:hypothetical protein
MKLFTKGIDKKLFAQFPKGGSLEGQKVIAKVFNPYGRGRWYIMNSDPDEPNYLWGIVQLFEGEPEVGSFSREELENIRVGAFKLPLERDLYFDEMDAMEVYNGLKSGKTFEHGGEIGEGDKYMFKKGDKVVYLVNSTTGRYIDFYPKIINDINYNEKFPIIKLDNYWEFQWDGKGFYSDELGVYLEKSSYADSGMMANGGEMDDRKTLKVGDAYLYRDETHYLVKRNGEVGLVSYAQGAWGGGGRFLPLQKMFRSDLEENLTDFKGNKLNIPSYDELMEQPYGFMEHGGEIDEVAEMLKGKYVNIFSMGVENPISTDIVEAKISDPKFRYQTLSLSTRGGGEERIEGKEKINAFLKGEMVYVRDSSEEYGIQLIDTFDKGGVIKLLDQYDIDKGNYEYRAYKGAIGSFAWRNDNNKYNEGILFPLDDFDKDFYSHIQLKEGEVLFRYKTAIMGTNLFPLIKVNFDRAVVHFLDDSTDEKNPKFYRRGTPLIYITLERYYYEVREFAKGGETSNNIYKHKYIPTMTFEFTDYTSKGVKGIQKDSKSLSAKERKEGKIVTYTTSELNELFTKSNEFSKGGKLKDATYIPNRNIKQIVANLDGKEVNVMGKDIFDGVYLKKLSKTTPKVKFDAKEIATELSNMAYDIWDKLKIESGSQIYASKPLQIKLAKYFELKGIDEKYFKLTPKQRIVVSEILTDENQHSLNNYLALRGYRGEEEYQGYVRMFEMDKKRPYVINPDAIERKLSKDGDFKGYSYAKGGKLLTTRQRYTAELKGLSGVSQNALDDFIDENKLSDDEILNIVIGLGRKQIKTTDFVSAVVGNKDNVEYKKLMTFIKSDEALRA